MTEYFIQGLNRFSLIFATACKGNPVISTTGLILYYFMINTFMALIETLVFGERFEHWLDVVVQLFFIAYAAYMVDCCATVNEQD